MKISSRLLKGFMAAAPKSDVRYYLNGIYVAGTQIEVTNGHYLLKAYFEDDDTEPEEDKIFCLTGNIPATARDTEICFDKKQAIHKDKEGRVVGLSFVEIIDGKWPDTKKVIEGFAKCKIDEIGYNPEYAGLPHKIFGATGAKFTFGGENAIARIQFKTRDHEDVDFYIMPMRL